MNDECISKTEMDNIMVKFPQLYGRLELYKRRSYTLRFSGKRGHGACSLALDFKSYME